MIYLIENINNSKYTDALYKKAYSAMSLERRKKADRYKHASDKRLCVFSDMLLREMLKVNFGIENPLFCLSENGKPRLAGDKLHLSISHSGHFIACAVDTYPVGIDIEVPREIHKRVIDHCCTEDESDYICPNLSALADPIPADSIETYRFLTLWTAKEAFLKYTGKGLGGGLKNIITVEKGKLKGTINNKKLLTVTEKDYIFSVISESI